MTVGQTESKLKARGIGKPHWYGAMYQAQRTDLLPLIPKSSRCVLDVGCCTGNLGAILKERGAYVAGVEIDAEAADLATRKLDRVVIASAEAIDLPFQESFFDCVIYGDVLEHLLDPWAAIRRHTSFIEPGGTVITSIPNVQYWRVILNLLRGRWNYTTGGSLDWGHLRFFTLTGMTAMLEQAGYANIEVFHSAHGRRSAPIYAFLPPRLRPFIVWRYYLRGKKMVS